MLNSVSLVSVDPNLLHEVPLLSKNVLSKESLRDLTSQSQVGISGLIRSWKFFFFSFI